MLNPILISLAIDDVPPLDPDESSGCMMELCGECAVDLMGDCEVQDSGRCQKGLDD